MSGFVDGNDSENLIGLEKGRESPKLKMSNHQLKEGLMGKRDTTGMRKRIWHCFTSAIAVLSIAMFVQAAPSARAAEISIIVSLTLG